MVEVAVRASRASRRMPSYDVPGPAALRAMGADALDALADDIRAFLVSSVQETGGHLGPNLGVVELTIALHRVFDSPRDAIVWDTGHQAYVHKLLTGRAAGFDRLRQQGGLSGYPSRAESRHDLVENSHASTALAYADGLAKAAAARPGVPRRVVAVVGDGALTGGLAFEALNNIGAAPERPVVIVLNDNGRSYAPTVGGLAAHLAQLRDYPTTSLPSVTTPRGPREDHPATRPAITVFEQLGLAYLGPVDGHDRPAVELALARARDLGMPVVVHVLTVKGKGFVPAETDEADRLHSVSGRSGSVSAAPTEVPRPGWTEVFADELSRIADARPDVVGVTAAMLRPTGLHPFARDHPDRVHDVGIAEAAAVTSAAGMAMGGLHPVVCIYSTFLNRAFDQVLMDVALHRLPVTFVLDRAGVTGNDGPSHHGMWDLTLLATAPGMRVAAPRDAETLRELLREAVGIGDGPTALRFPKGSAARPIRSIGKVGAGDLLHGDPGRGDVLIAAVGPLAGPAVAAAQELAGAGLTATVVDPRWVLPVDPALVAAAARHRLVLTAEDSGVAGGFGDAVGRAMREASVDTPLRTLGLRQQFLEHGSRDRLLGEQGLDCAGIAAAARLALGRRAQVRVLG